MDYHENRQWGRIKVSHALTLRSGYDPQQSYKVVSVDLSEENIGIETDASLAIGEPILLELETQNRTVSVQAVVKRIFNNRYGCLFSEEDFGAFFSYSYGQA